MPDDSLLAPSKGVPTWPRQFKVASKAQQRALLELANASNQQEGLPLKLEIGIEFVHRGWAERGLQYPLFRITDAGRRALSAALAGRLGKTAT
jgi:hypothetical protein